MYNKIRAGIAVQTISSVLAWANFAGFMPFFSLNFHKASKSTIPTLTPIATKMHNNKL